MFPRGPVPLLQTGIQEKLNRDAGGKGLQPGDKVRGVDRLREHLEIVPTEPRQGQTEPMVTEERLRG